MTKVLSATNAILTEQSDVVYFKLQYNGCWVKPAKNLGWGQITTGPKDENIFTNVLSTLQISPRQKVEVVSLCPPLARGVAG